jgi:ubiquinone/menaquinone biosynthesis C-methylase UbiE
VGIQSKGISAEYGSVNRYVQIVFDQNIKNYDKSLDIVSVINMSKSGLDSNQDRIRQQKSWDSVAAGWQKWWKTFEKGAQKVSNKLVEIAEIKPGQKVLDIATGIGEPAITAARVVGDKGHVTATDISPEMLAIGKERAQHEGLKNIEFKKGDAETMDLPSSSFDAAVCRWGLMFIPNLPAALDNIHRSLVSGGRLAATVWAEPTKVPQLNLPMTIVRQELQLLLPPATGIPGPFSLADLNELKNSLIQAEFRDIRSENIQVTFEFNSAEDYVRFTKEIAAPVNAMLANETEERKTQIWNKVTDQVKAQYTEDNGRVKMDNEAICIVAKGE